MVMYMRGKTWTKIELTQGNGREGSKEVVEVDRRKKMRKGRKN